MPEFGGQGEGTFSLAIQVRDDCKWLSIAVSSFRPPGTEDESLPPRGAHGRTWAYMGVLGRAWACMGVHGCAWACMGVYGRTWVRMGVLGRTWCACHKEGGGAGKASTGLHWFLL